MTTYRKEVSAVPKKEKMLMRKISLLVSLSLLSAVCTAQGLRVPTRGISQLHIPRKVKFQKPVRPVTSNLRSATRFKRSTGFLQKDRMLTLVINQRNEALINLLSERLQPFAYTRGGVLQDQRFSGHFVRSKKALNHELTRYTKPEFWVSRKQAVRDMLIEAVRSPYGYGVVKIMEAGEIPGAEPRMTMLVLDFTNMEWMKYPEKAASVEKEVQSVKPATLGTEESVPSLESTHN